MPADFDAPILESGDRLSRAEFHRRFCARVDIKKAELVEGVVYVASPGRIDGHGGDDNIVQMWLGVNAARYPDPSVGANATVFLDADNELQPDACVLWRDRV